MRPTATGTVARMQNYRTYSVEDARRFAGRPLALAWEESFEACFAASFVILATSVVTAGTLADDGSGLSTLLALVGALTTAGVAGWLVTRAIGQRYLRKPWVTPAGAQLLTEFDAELARLSHAIGPTPPTPALAAVTTSLTASRADLLATLTRALDDEVRGFDVKDQLDAARAVIDQARALVDDAVTHLTESQVPLDVLTARKDELTVVHDMLTEEKAVLGAVRRELGAA